MPDRTAVLAPLDNRTFRLLWLATLLSNLGLLVQSVGASWTMTTMTGSHNMIALVQASTTLPIMLFSIFAGALADSFDRRTLMLIAQGSMMVVATTLTMLAMLDLLTPWLLLCFTFLMGCGLALFNPSWQSSVGDIVPREHLPGAVTLNAMGFNAMRSVGPAVGGLVVALAGAAAAFAINALFYVPFLLATATWKPHSKSTQLPRENFVGSIGVGLRYVSLSPNLLKVMLRGSLFGFSAVVIVSLLPSVTNTYVGGGALTYGTLLGCFGLGAVGGGLINSRLRERFSNEAIVRLGCIGFALGSVTLGVSRDPLLSHLALLPAGACWVAVVSLLNVSIQLSSPRWVLGRALSLYQTATFGGMSVGAWFWGRTADAFGLDLALLMAGAGLLLCAAIGLLSPVPHFNSRNLDPLDRADDPVIDFDLSPNSGPIVVTIDYTIAQDDIPQLLTLMAERRHIRLRDGARHWSLLRDLQTSDIWTESYQVPTWTDYLRHKSRRTKADAENIERLLRLHRGVQPPAVRRQIKQQTDVPHDHPPSRRR